MGPPIGLELCRRGVGVIVFAQRRDAPAAVAAVLAAGGRAESMHLDVSSAAGVAAFWAAFSARFDRLDYLVNVSGDCPRTPIAAVAEAELLSAFAVNAAGPFFMCQAARPLMWRSGGGAIVNIGSVAGEDGAFAASVAYSMAKGALKSMMKQLAKQGFPPEAYAPGAPPRSAFPLVRCNNVAPGPVATPMLASMSAADQQKIRDGTLTDGVTGCEEVAKSVRLRPNRPKARGARARSPRNNHAPPLVLPPTQVAFLLLDAKNNTGQTIVCAGGIVRT
jgi:NAD(P)-dependent dehydrogenase (short-subunit alcohol dehydrogenase family)